MKQLISKRTNYLLLAAVALLVIVPLAFVKGEFGGSDDQGSAAVASSVGPGFKPWAHPIWTPPSPEVESLLFAAQAAFGAGIIGYVLGRIHGAQSRDGKTGKDDKASETARANVAH